MTAASPDPKEIVGLALEYGDASERMAFLNKVCRGHPKLRAEVESLLNAYDRQPEFLEEGPAGKGGLGAAAEDLGTLSVPTATEQPGVVIAGRYKLLEVIGEGGMGTVWAAQQTEPVRRRVAVKLIKPGMDTRQVLSRFEAERQALALMDHPNIARVFDGGMTEQGRPYFVMEYAKGIPITTYCDECRLSLQERLELFVPVCQAVQHAHQKGIIHRDLKPTNILICLYDGRPVPKVIDFGLAKATHQPLTEQTLFTAHGLMVGTPLYMSPEQADFNNFDIDTRTDVYSLGVILYELMTGSTPLDRQQLKDAAWQEIVRLIKEAEPSKPSTKLSDSQALPTLAAQRKLEPAQLNRLVRGDLDWIVMKALEKDRDRRYETANGFARDVERYLADELVEARPPSAGYRLRKIIHRNKAALTTLALVALALVVGTALSTWQAIRATRAEEQVTETLHEVERQRDRAGRELDRAVKAEELAEQRLTEVEQERDRATQAEEKARSETAIAQAATQEKAIALGERTAALQLAQANESLATGRFYAAQMNLISQAWRDGQHARTVELLETLRPAATEPDLRGFEWYHQYDLSHANVVHRWRAHNDTILDIVWSPDDKWFASAADGQVRIWDGRTGALTGSIPIGVRNIFWDLDLSPDGRLLVGGCSTGEVFIWDVPAKREVQRWMAHPVDNGVRAIGISPDGQRIATGAEQGEAESRGSLSLWDLEGHQLAEMEGHHTCVGALAFSPVGETLASATMPWFGPSRSNILIWNISRDPTKLSEVPGVGAYGLCFSEDGQTLWGCGGSFPGQGWAQSILEVDIQTGAIRPTHSGHSSSVTRLSHCDRPNQVITASADRTLRLRDVDSGESRVIGAELAKIMSVAGDRTGRFVVCGDNDGWLTLRDLAAPPPIVELRQNQHPGGGDSINSLAFSPDGQRLFVGFQPLNIVDAETLELEEVGPQGAIMAISPNCDLVAARDHDGQIEIWDVATRTTRTRIDCGQRTKACLSSDGKYLATWQPFSDPTFDLWDAQTGQLVDTVTADPGGHCSFMAVTFSPDSSRLATGNQFLRSNVYDVATRRLIDSQRVVGQIVSVACIAYSGDGTLLAAGGDDGHLAIYAVEPESGKLSLRSRLLGHADGVRALAFIPDQTTLVSASADGTVRFWDVELAQERMSLDLDARLLAFSPNGDRLAIVTGNKTLLVLRGSKLPEARARRTWRGAADPAKDPELAS